jgi:predicted membrane GTPase involved in stress response
VIYAAARDGWALNSLDDGKPRKGVHDLLEAMIDYIPTPKTGDGEPTQMLVTQTASD